MNGLPSGTVAPLRGPALWIEVVVVEATAVTVCFARAVGSVIVAVADVVA